MNLAYQTARHVAQHMRQWPQSNRAEVERDISQRLATGNAWHYREPQQMELGL